jgi:hypothetical protein
VSIIGLSDKKQVSDQTSSTTAKYDYLTPPSTPALDTLRSKTFEIDPGIAAQYGRQRSDLNRGFANPTGGYASPQVRDMQRQSGLERLGRDEAQAMREGQYDVNKLGYGRDIAVAGMSAPQLVQSGSTGTQKGTTIQSESPWGAIASAGAQAAPLSL